MRTAARLALAAALAALPTAARAQLSAPADAPRPRAAAAPVYPELLAGMYVEGDVAARFVVGPDGRADMRTFAADRAAHPLFAAAVRDAVARSRYLPARADGRAVAAAVEQTFEFRVAAPGAARADARIDGRTDERAGSR